MEKITNFYEFVQWCFKDTTSGFATTVVLGMILSAIVSVIRAFLGVSECSCECDKDEEDN